ncbi:MAG: hypothetical protein ACYDDF_10710 [Thermoplasmatota archaeon]
MASSTVKIREADKKRLDQLQATLTVESGEKISLEDLIGRLIQMGMIHRRELRRDPRKPADMAWLESLIFDTGQVTREEDINRELYGGPE